MGSPFKNKGSDFKWMEFDKVTLNNLIQDNRIILLDFTADWCTNCKVFERQFLKTPETMKLFAQHQVIPLVADLTKTDSELWGLLGELGRNGLPVYVIYHSDGRREVLPEGPPLTLQSRIEALTQKEKR